MRCRSGARVWIFQYTLGTAKRRVTRRFKIGDFSALAPGKAREQAADLHARVHLGQDPAAEKKKRRIDAGNTVGWLVEKYLAFKERELRKRSFEEVQRHLRVHTKPLHGLPIGSIDQRIIAGRLTAIAGEGGGPTANRVRSSLHAMFKWAMGEGLASTNPVMNTNKRKEQSRTRVLSNDELRAIWQATNGDHYGAIVRLLMLTGQRRDEVAGLRWSEIKFDRVLIELPPERTKNKRVHEVPITKNVQEVLEKQPRAEGRDFVFGYSGGPFSGWSKAKDALDKAIAKTSGKPLAHWTLHDLRRTVATRMNETPDDGGLGILPHVVEAVLNHVSGFRGGGGWRIQSGALPLGQGASLS